MSAGVVGDIKDIVNVKNGKAQAIFFNFSCATAKNIGLIT
jgi:hypothetical protein